MNCGGEEEDESNRGNVNKCAAEDISTLLRIGEKALIGFGAQKGQGLSWIGLIKRTS